MFSVDTSSLVAFLRGEEGKDVSLLERILSDGLLTLTPPVIAEMLSDPMLPNKHQSILLQLPRVETKDGFWERVGLTRRSLIVRKRKARLADTMISQFCLDHSLTLITRDKDYEAFQQICSLKVVFKD